jgi:MFS family permease
VHRGGFLLIALAPFFFRGPHLPAIVVALWALGAVPGALINLSWTAAVAEMVPPQRRPSVNGFRWALVSLVTAVSVAGFGYLLEHTPSPIGYQIVFAISFLGGLLSMYFWSRIRLPPLAPSGLTPLPPEGSRGSTLAQRLKAYLAPIAEESAFVRFLLTTFVLRFGLNLPTALYSIYWIRNLKASDLWIGWRGTASSLALVVGYFAWGRIASRKGHHPVLLACTLGLGLYPILTALVKTQILLPVVALVFGLFVTGIDLAFFDTLLHICPTEKRASFVAINLLFADLAVFVAPMAGSLLTRWVDIRTLFFVAGAFHLVALVLFWLFRIGVE